MSAPFVGGCACGALRYRCTAEPYVSYARHCTECRKRTGSAYGVSLQVPAEAVTIEAGTPKRRARTADSGNTINSSFCAACGTTIMSENEARPHIRVIFAGTLDDPSWVPILADIFTDSAMPWVHLDADVERFPRMPDFSKYFG